MAKFGHNYVIHIRGINLPNPNLNMPTPEFFNSKNAIEENLKQVKKIYIIKKFKIFEKTKYEEYRFFYKIFENFELFFTLLKFQNF